MPGEIKRDKGGKFMKGVGGPGKGRKRGVRIAFSEAFVKDFAKAWEKYGEKCLVEMAKNDPTAFVKCACVLVPKVRQIDHRVHHVIEEIKGLTDEQLADRIRRLESECRALDSAAGIPAPQTPTTH